MKKSFYLLPALILSLFAGCAEQKEDHQMGSDESEIISAVALLTPTKGNDVSGLVTFTKTENAIKVTADINGLTPGEHGFHIHQYGDLSSGDGASAGGHFNPAHHPHSSRTSAKRHVGDLGNISADAKGEVHIELVDTVISFSGINSIIGRAVVVHQKADDLSSQPSGAAGSRLAWGVVGIAE